MSEAGPQASSLTPRQLEVLELMAKGLTNPEIARVLGIAAGTVKVHVSAVIDALDVSNRTEAAVALRELELGERRASGPAKVPGFGERPAIAVLPFDNLGADPEHDAFADGLSEDLTTALACGRWFPVIARNSAFVYRGQSVDVKHAAAELGARYVVEGSTRQSGDRVRINVQLIDGESGSHVLAERYDREVKDVFAVQDEIVTAVFAALEPALVRVEGLRAMHKPPQELTVWEAFQRGLVHSSRQSPEEIELAVGCLQDVIARDAGFAPAHAALAMVRITEAALALGGTASDREADMGAALARSAQRLQEAVPLARRAVELDPWDASAQGALGAALTFVGQGEEGESALRRSLDLNPSSAMISWGLATILLRSERADEACPLAERAVRLSPRDPMLHHFFGALTGAYLLQGRNEESLHAIQRSLEVSPEGAFNYRPTLVACLALVGRVEEARREAREIFERAPNFNLGMSRLFAPDRLIDLMIETYAGLGFELK